MIKLWDEFGAIKDFTDQIEIIKLFVSVQMNKTALCNSMFCLLFSYMERKKGNILSRLRGYQAFVSP